ncbi:hypothetical protein ACROSR_16100 [Roseovarius tibetensis]
MFDIESSDMHGRWKRRTGGRAETVRQARQVTVVPLDPCDL